jgi:hypothetical protein
MDVTRYIMENRVTGAQQNVSESELAAIQKNPRVGSMWFVKETLPGAITKSIPPAGIKVNSEEPAQVENETKPAKKDNKNKIAE